MQKNSSNLDIDRAKRHLQLQAKAMGLLVTERQLGLLVEYVQLLVKWNKAYNLTAVRDPREMLDRHIIDSLSVLPFLTGRRILDVGSGAGLPGIPLAILNADVDVILLDSNGKKTRFLTQAKMTLKLDNLTVVNSRVEDYFPVEKFDQIFSRAFSSLDNMTTWCQHLCKPVGEFVAMKGQYPAAEIAELGSRFMVRAAHSIVIPTCPDERHLIMIASSGSSKEL